MIEEDSLPTTMSFDKKRHQYGIWKELIIHPALELQQQTIATTENNSSKFFCCVKTNYFRCHCVLLQQNFKKKQEKLFPSSTVLSSFTTCALLKLPSFFKLALLLLAVNSITVSASPLLPRNTLKERSARIRNEIHRGLEKAVELAKFKRNYSNKQPVNGFLEKILSRKKRSSCTLTTFTRLSQLSESVYDIVNEASAHSLKRRRNTREQAERSWKEATNYIHGKLKKIYCDISRSGKNIFGSETASLKLSLQTMIDVLQVQMNCLQLRFDASITCGSQTPKPSKSKIENDIYFLKVELNKLLQVYQNGN